MSTSALNIGGFRIHELKCWQEPFRGVWHGSKTYEIRKNDRDYRVRDLLVLREWDHVAEKYVGRSAIVRVTYITAGGEWGISPDLCVLAIKVLERVYPGEGRRNSEG